jgi:hypothetical protein
MSLSVDMELFDVVNGVNKWWTYLSFQIPGFTELVLGPYSPAGTKVN